ncbi:MAG: phage tail protein [Niabella sp.]
MSTPGVYYPPVGFHFKVVFQIPGAEEIDSRFQSVSGLSVEYDTEIFKEGGENRFEHKLPIRTRYPDLSLKRGMVVNSPLVGWCLSAFQERLIVPVTMFVTLLNENHVPLKTWSIYNAWPKKWSVSDLNAQESTIVIESLDLCYSYFKIL